MRTEPEIVNGYWHTATHCARCEKPFAPYGVAVATENVANYCWQEHELHDQLAHAFISGVVHGSEHPQDAGDSDAMGDAARRYIASVTEPEDER